MKHSPCLLFIAMILSCAQIDTRRSALESLVQAETAFAKTSVEKGIRTAFLSYLADSAIVFRPHPTNGQAVYRERADTPITLNWRPLYADVASSGDWGYTTGPWEITDNSSEKRPPAYGDFFSVWQKQGDGNWKVIIDIGIAHEAPKNLPQEWQSPVGAKISSLPHTPAEIAHEKNVLLQTDESFSGTAAAQGLVAAYQAHLADEARLLRSGQFPLVEKEAIYAKLAERQGISFWQPLRVQMARSLDLAYTMGAYEFKPAEQTAEMTKGYYVRVWKKQSDTSWKVVLDVENTLPPETNTKNNQG